MEVRLTGFAFSALSACVRDTQRGCEGMEGSICLMFLARVSIVENPSKTRDQTPGKEFIMAEYTVLGGERAFAKVDASRGYELTLRGCGH